MSRPLTRAAALLLLLLAAVTTASAQYIASSKSYAYHTSGCRYVQRILPENRVEYMTTQAAEAAGKVPCKVCKPASTTRTHNATVPSSDATTHPHNATARPGGGGVTASPDAAATSTTARPLDQYNTRCQAITKRGTQCRRNAQPGSRFCWQHQR